MMVQIGLRQQLPILKKRKKVALKAPRVVTISLVNPPSYYKKTARLGKVIKPVILAL